MTFGFTIQRVPSSKMPKTETLNLRVSAEFKKRLMEAAVKERRSVTNYLEATITAVWEQRQNSDAKTKGKKQPAR
jgi:predicted HicB family RNase H-like nuclease